MVWSSIWIFEEQKFTTISENSITKSLTMRQVSGCGIGCFSCMSIAITVCCVVALTTKYWLIELSDNCVDVTYSIYLREICVSGSAVNDECTEWEQVKTDDVDGDAAGGRGDYLDAYGLAVTSAILSAVCAVCIMGSTTLTDMEWVKTIIRIGAIGVMLFNSIGLAISIAITFDNYYTDPDNYDAYGCEVGMSSSDVGSYFMVLALIFSISLCMALIYPCCQCAEPDEKDQGAVNLMTASAPSMDGV